MGIEEWIKLHMFVDSLWTAKPHTKRSCAGMKFY
jgi:hypothetical protein